ncbi:hypothetical protein INS49_005745 [Diaporthe citri]|uniref:uncharacterized protein n=1 Tax=Diaporthe citri TaxID=83186 RepID=UPI001C80649E|nr:uncharacterized protein INS49_005745 [Diaporthe citri]KAG6364147.1 hypothetical protein INS49_005745 [Diaporthe citri]
MEFTRIAIALALQTAAVLAAPPVSPEDAAVNAAVPQGCYVCCLGPPAGCVTCCN